MTAMPGTGKRSHDVPLVFPGRAQHVVHIQLERARSA